MADGTETTAAAAPIHGQTIAPKLWDIRWATYEAGKPARLEMRLVGQNFDQWIDVPHVLIKPEKP